MPPDLEWIDATLRRDGVAAVVAHLDGLDGPLHRAVAAAAHLLRPVEPPAALTDILLSRLAASAELRTTVAAYAATLPARPRLVNRWPLPDGPHPALRRVLNTSEGRVLALSADGGWLVCIGSDARNHVVACATATVWDLTTGAVRHRLTDHHRRITGIAIAPDQTWLATTDDDTVRIWDAATGAPRLALRVAGDRPDEDVLLHHVAIAPDGSWLASGSHRGSVRTWDAATGRPRLVTAEAEPTKAVAIAGDGGWFAAIDDYGRGWVWDAATGALRHRFEGPRFDAVASAPDGSWLATAGGDHVIRLRDAATGRVRLTIKGHTDDVNAVAVAPEGTWLASGADDGTVRLWDTTTGRQLGRLDGHGGHVQAVALCADGTVLASVDHWGEIRVWDTVTGRAGSGAGISGPVNGLVCGPDGSWLAGGVEGGVRIWDVATGRARQALTGRRDEHPHTLAVAPDSTWLASDGTHRVLIWEPDSGVVRHVLDDRLNAVRSVAVAPDGRWLAVAAHQSVSVWDAATGRERWRHKGATHEVAIAPDGGWLATTGPGDRVRIWHPATGEPLFELTTSVRYLGALAIAPDGGWLAVAGQMRDPVVEVWDTATGRVRTTLTGVAATVLAVTPDGRWLAVADHAGTVTVWDATTWRAAAAMRVDGSVTGCCWLPDGGLCLSGDKGIYVYDFTATSGSSP
jgi:WD40 repeat protein